MAADSPPPGYDPFDRPGYPPPGTPPPGYPPPGYPPPGAAPPGYGPPGYGPPGYYPPSYDPNAPYGFDWRTGLPFSHKSKIVAGLLSILLGAFGVGRFYTGHVGIGIAQILVTWLTCGFGSIWPLIDGIVVLANGGTDSNGLPLRDR